MIKIEKYKNYRTRNFKEIKPNQAPDRHDYYNSLNFVVAV